MSDKGKGKGNNNNTKKCTKDICNPSKFTLILTLKYQSGKTEKLKGHFMSKSGVGGCDLPDQKPFQKARKKLLDNYKNSQKENTDKSKADNKLINIGTQIIHNNNGRNVGCTNCRTDFGGCGCLIGTIFGTACFPC